MAVALKFSKRRNRERRRRILDAATRVFDDRSLAVACSHQGADDFATRCPEQYKALMECTAFVNLRQKERGLPPLLALAPET